MSLSFDAKCQCAACGLELDAERGRNGNRIETKGVPGGKETLVEATKPCPSCSSYRVKLTVSAKLRSR